MTSQNTSHTHNQQLALHGLRDPRYGQVCSFERCADRFTLRTVCGSCSRVRRMSPFASAPPAPDMAGCSGPSFLRLLSLSSRAFARAATMLFCRSRRPRSGSTPFRGLLRRPDILPACSSLVQSNCAHRLFYVMTSRAVSSSNAFGEEYRRTELGQRSERPQTRS